MMGAPPLLRGYLIFAALALELCLHLEGTMTAPMHCQLVLSRGPLMGSFSFVLLNSVVCRRPS
jgi:hypothetical protein